MQIRQNFTDVNGRNVTTEWSSPMITDPKLRLILYAKSFGDDIYNEWYKVQFDLPDHNAKCDALIDILKAKNISTQI
jgi:hypothetical protein